MKQHRAVRICDTDGAEQDEFVIIPDDMTLEAAADFVDAQIIAVKTQFPNDYDYKDLFLRLGERGFTGLTARPTSQTF